MNKKNNSQRRITIGGNIPRRGQLQPAIVRLTQPKRFNVDTADFMTAIKAAENVDYAQRSKLYDLYTDILLDAHLSSVIEKRKNAVLCSAIDFKRDGKSDDSITEQIRSPWFNRCVSDILDARFWGFSLLQFYKNGDWIDYDLIPHKHVEPVRKLILARQTDLQGTPWEEFSEYIYETDDEEARARALQDANSIGSLATFIHGKDTELQLREAGNKTGTADVYERFVERCNSEISKLILGNTLTTEASDKGTQALGTVHKKVEEKMALADRRYVLDVLNYDMTDIFARMGINTAGGKFCFPEKKDTDPNTDMSVLTQLHTTFSLPIDDDYLYEKFGIEKPKDYDRQKQRKEEERKIQQQTMMQPKEERNTDEEQNPNPKGKSVKLKDRLHSFFVKAPDDGARLDW